MKILNIVPGISARGGGIYSAAWRIHEALTANGVDSHIFTRGQTPINDKHHVYVEESKIFPRIMNRLEFTALSISRKYFYGRSESNAIYEGFHDGRSHDGNSIVSQLPDCDIYHIHLLDTFIGYDPFFSKLSIAQTVPTRNKLPNIWGCQPYMNPV